MSERVMSTVTRDVTPHAAASPPASKHASFRALSIVARYLLGGAIVIAIAATAAGAVTYLVRSNEPATYRATTEFAIVPSALLSDGQAADQVESVAALDRPIVNATVSELLESGVVAETAAKAINLPLGELDEYEFTASEVPGAAIVRLSVQGPDAETTQALAQAVQDANGPIGDYLIGIFDVRSIDESSASVSKVAPAPARDATAVALAVALAAAAVVIVMQLRRGERADLATARPKDGGRSE
jgi:capsular polysaccharide biosynthesis protein